MSPRRQTIIRGIVTGLSAAIVAQVLWSALKSAGISDFEILYVVSLALVAVAAALWRCAR